MPGHTCIDQFLQRISTEYSYLPEGHDHNAFRRWASQWRGRCHTSYRDMLSVVKELTSAATGPNHRKNRSSAEGRHRHIGLPPRQPRVVEVLGDWAPWREPTDERRRPFELFGPQPATGSLFFH